MGRFGGGWQWAVGFKASAGFRTIILELLVLSVRIERGRRECRAKSWQLDGFAICHGPAGHDGGHVWEVQ